MFLKFLAFATALIVSGSRNMSPNSFSFLHICESLKFHHFLKYEDNFKIIFSMRINQQSSLPLEHSNLLQLSSLSG